MSVGTRKFVINNFNGGMVTIAEDNAFNEIDPSASLGPGVSALKTEFKSIQNFLPIYRGGLSKAKGFRLVANVGTSPITGIYRFLQSTGANTFLITAGATLYKLTGSVSTAIYTSLNNNAYTHMTTALDQCVICDGYNYPQVYNGSTVTSLGGGAPGGARQSLFYKNRLWVFSATNNEGYLYYSNPNDISTGYSTNFVQCDYNDGQKITAIAAFLLREC